MLIPEDGSLPQITRKGFAAFNNVMLIKVPEKLLKPRETNFQLATLDRSKKGERWPADQYVDIIMNTPNPRETSSAENSSNCKEGNIRKYGKFRPKKFKTSSKKLNDFSEKNQNQEISNSVLPVVSTDTGNFKPQFAPNGFHDQQVPQRRFGDNHVQYNERPFNDNAHTYRYSNEFSSNHQSYRRHDSLLGEGTSFNPLQNRYGAQGQTVSATISRDPTIGDRPYNGDFDFRGNPPPFPAPFVTNPLENDFNRVEISNPNFVEVGRNAHEPFIRNVPNAYSTNNYNEVPRNSNFERETFPLYNSNRPEFMNNNNFERPPYDHTSVGAGLNNSFNAGNVPPLLPLPPHHPFETFNNGHFQNNCTGRNPHHDQKIWKNRNQPNSNYHRKGGNKRMHNSWRGRGAPNKFSKGNNNRRTNDRYHGNKQS